MTTPTIGLRVVAGLAVTSLMSFGAVAVAAAAEEPEDATAPTMVSEQLASGNEMIIYVPAGDDTGYRAVSTPILLVVGDEDVDVDSARQSAEASGLAQIADQEQGVVAFLNSEDANWAASDRDGVRDLLARFGDNTGELYNNDGKSSAGLYPGGKSRVYVFAEGSGADFVSQHVVPGIDYTGPFTPTVLSWTPSAVFIANPTTTPVAPALGAEIPAYIVNGSDEIDGAYSALNAKNGLFGTADSTVTDGFDRSTLLQGYGDVVSHAIVRTADVNPFNEVYTIPDYAEEGIGVSHETVDVDGKGIEYFQYLPDSADMSALPVLFLFHGGGNHAEYQAWATGWPIIAKENGFMVVSVNRHVDKTAADVVGLLDTLIAKYPGIDRSRIYATGYSMGAAKSWELGEEFTQRFAAISPTNGSFQPAPPVNDLIMPTFYVAGAVSPLPELPHQEYIFGQYSRQPTDIDARLGVLFSQNRVSEGYTFNEQADPLWGVAPDKTFTVNDTQFTGLSVKVNTYASSNGGTYTALASVANGSHEPFNAASKLAWDFMSQFSRNADGSISSTEAPVATAAPAITGKLDVGTRATATSGTWNIEGLTFSYQWLRNGQPIAGATNDTYTVRAGDQGAALSVRVMASKTGFANGEAVSAERAARSLAYAIVTTNKLVGTTSTSFTVNVKITAANGVAVNGPATVKVGSKNYTADIVNGQGNIVIGTQKKGIHPIVVTFGGTDTVSPTAGVGVIIVR